MVYSKHSYQGTARIIREVCGEIGLMMIRKQDYAPEYVSQECYLKDKARIKSITLYQKKLIEGSALESLYYRFFPGKAREGLNKKIPDARRILSELEDIAGRYSGYRKEMSDDYFLMKREKVKAAYNVKKHKEIIEKLEDDKTFVFPRTAAVGREDTGDAMFAKKQSEIDLEERIEAIQKDIDNYANAMVCNALFVRLTKKEIEHLDEQRARVNDIVSNAEQNILCGSMYVEHAERMLNYIIDGEDVVSKCLEFRDALLGINESLGELMESMDEKMGAMKEYNVADIFKNLYSWPKRRRSRSKKGAEIDMSIVEEALMELQPEEEKKCGEE